MPYERSIRAYPKTLKANPEPKCMPYERSFRAYNLTKIYVVEKRLFKQFECAGEHVNGERG